mgnify:CR=1 FL=1
MQHINILMVDDHPIIIEGYQNTLMATKNDDQVLVIDTANNCDTANELLQKASKEKPYDVCFFDISLPSSSDGSITSGEDLAKIARDILPNAKIIIVTGYIDENLQKDEVTAVFSKPCNLEEIVQLIKSEIC